MAILSTTELGFGSPEVSAEFTPSLSDGLERAGCGVASAAGIVVFALVRSDLDDAGTINIDVYKDGTSHYSFSRTHGSLILAKGSGRQSVWVHEKSGKIRIAYTLTNTSGTTLSKFVVEEFDTSTNALTQIVSQSVSHACYQINSVTSFGQPLVEELTADLSGTTAYITASNDAAFTTALYAFYLFGDSFVGSTKSNSQAADLILGQRVITSDANSISLLKTTTNVGPNNNYYSYAYIDHTTGLWNFGATSVTIADEYLKGHYPSLPSTVSGHRFTRYDPGLTAGSRVVISDDDTSWSGTDVLPGDAKKDSLLIAGGANAGKLWLSNANMLVSSSSSDYMPIWSLDHNLGQYGYQELAWPTSYPTYAPWDGAVAVDPDGKGACFLARVQDSPYKIQLVMWGVTFGGGSDPNEDGVPTGPDWIIKDPNDDDLWWGRFPGERPPWKKFKPSEDIDWNDFDPDDYLDYPQDPAYPGNPYPPGFDFGGDPPDIWTPDPDDDGIFIPWPGTENTPCVDFCIFWIESISTYAGNCGEDWYIWKDNDWRPSPTFTTDYHVDEDMSWCTDGDGWVYDPPIIKVPEFPGFWPIIQDPDNEDERGGPSPLPQIIIHGRKIQWGGRWSGS